MNDAIRKYALKVAKKNLRKNECFRNPLHHHLRYEYVQYFRANQSEHIDQKTHRVLFNAKLPASVMIFQCCKRRSGTQSKPKLIDIVICYSGIYPRTQL